MNLVRARSLGPLGRLLGGWWRHQRLRTRLVALSVALLLLVQLASYLVIRQGIEANARRMLAQRIDSGAQVWQRLLDQRAATLHQGAALLAADFGFREAVASKDQDTVSSALDNHRQRIHATLAALLDTQLRLVATNDTMAMGDALPQALQRLAPQLAKAPGSGVVGLVNGQAVQFVMVPMRAPVLVGWVVMGFPLDRRVLTQMAGESGLVAAVLAQPVSAEPELVASSLPATVNSQPLATQLADGDLQLDHAQWLVQTLPLANSPEGRLTLRLAGSVDAALAPYRGLQLLLGLITVLGLVLFAIGSLRLAQFITRPVHRLLRAAEQLGRGEHDLPLQFTGSGGELDELAAAFDQMRQGIHSQQQQIRALAYTDRLTELPNRLQFREAVGRAIADAASAAAAATTAAAAGAPAAQAGQAATVAGQALAAAAVRPVTVLMLGLDRFKHVNEVLGYAFGDRLLRAVAQRLAQVLRPGDTVARLGGDEFALLLPGADTAQGERLAQRIVAVFELPMQLDDHLVDLSAGIGIASWPLHAPDTDMLLSRAEVATYAAKRRTAGAQVYDPAVDTASAQTLSLLSELRRAVEQQELRLFLQPKVLLASGQAHAAEALVRWQHPQRGLVPPMAFIPFAEQTGFIRQLTLWMVEEVARQQAALAALGVMMVSVNLSTRDLMDTELPAKLDAILQRHGAQPQGFCLEITESAIMDDPQRAQGTLLRLSERGFKLSIDDFGTGYSSLAYLKTLPVNELKIDKSFVMKMERNPDDAQIVKLVIDLAHNLKLSVVAEGVENAAILALLHGLGCDEAQGYHLAKPMPVAQYIDWVQRWQPASAVPLPAAG